jgi:environmental stress-induced protein Ves
MPWKNGGGTTVEIARFPADATLDAFHWRISMARIERAGPFSRFPNVERSFSLCSGAAATLRVDGAAVTLARDAAPYTFSGEAAVSAELPAGPVEDLNVMTRQGVFRHVCRRLSLRAEVARTALADVTLLFVIRGTARASRGSSSFALHERDALLVDRGGPYLLSLLSLPSPENEAELIEAELWRA